MGYERFDGSFAPSLAYTNSITLIHDPVVYSITPYPVRSPVFLATDPINTFGTVVQAGATQTVVAVSNFQKFEALLYFLQGLSSETSVEMTSPIGSQSWIVTGYLLNAGADARATTILRNTQFNNLSSYVDTPDSEDFQSPVIGLRLYKDRLYAIRNLNRVYFQEGNNEPFPGQILKHIELGMPIEIPVLDITVTAGDWETGDAEGYILTYAPDGQLSYTLDNATTSISNVLTIKGIQPSAADLIQDVTQAGIWVSGDTTNPTWTPVDMGYEFSFRNGTSNGPPMTYFRGSLVGSGPETQTKASVATNVSLGATWSAVGGTPVQALANKDDLVYLTRTSSSINPGTQGYVSTYNFDSAINVPADATIQGIKITIRGAATGTSATKRFDVQLWSPAAFLGTAKSISFSNTLEDYVLGGEGDTWDVADIRAALSLPDFGFTINAYQSAANPATWVYDYAEMAVTYTRTIENYYFWNGTDDVRAEITNYFVDEGDWTLNNAHGFMQVASMSKVGAGTRTYITAGDEIRTLPGGAGVVIATVESNAKYATLPGLKLLEQNDSRYQMIVANFYGNEDWEAIYGVSGAGRGFSYDGYYFRRLFTGLSEEIDKPRHVIFFQHHLGLGYRAGNLTLSVIGEPENFDGAAGASSWDLGDAVTGLIRMNGSTLGIACKDSINSLTGSSIDDFSVRCINPYEGAIEYTVADIGKPVYCSYKGVSLFEQTAAYGDYLGVRLSAGITSWLTPRLQGRVPPIDIFTTEVAKSGGSPVAGTYIRQTTSIGPLVAIPVRSKNQYRLLFKDGTVMTMTLMGVEQKPVFTFQAAIVHNNDSEAFNAPYSNFIPRAECSSVDSLGRERIHMSHYNGPRDRPTGSNPWYVYEFERSWTFDGRGIPAYFITNSNFKDQPFTFGKIEKIRANGLSYGYAPCRVLASEGYLNADPSRVGQQEIQEINLPRAPAKFLASDFVPFTNIANVPKEGTSFNLTFLSYDTLGIMNPFDFKLADPCPPFAVQTLLLQTLSAKGDV